MFLDNIDFTISARTAHDIVDITNKLSSVINIESVFGFTEYTPLYGGRVFDEPQVTESDLNSLYSMGISFRIPLTNTLITKNDIIKSKSFLEKHHRKGNSVILSTTDKEIIDIFRFDYPNYSIESSVLLDPTTIEEIEDLLDLYDTVVLHGACNNKELLNHIDDKNRIRLFANMGCALNCPNRICYTHFSELNKGMETTGSSCSSLQQYRKFNGMTDFNLEELYNSGYTKFKLLYPEQYYEKMINLRNNK